METSSAPAVPTMEKETVNEQKVVVVVETKEVVVEDVKEESISAKEEMVNVPIQEEKEEGDAEAATKNLKEEPDAKKEEAKKSETPDVLCLQLDEGDNLDVYLEKERARKKELLKNLMKEEAANAIKKPAIIRKTKTVKRLKTVPKKKVTKIVQKKVKSKIVENNRTKEDKNQPIEELPHVKEDLNEIKEKDPVKEDDKIDHNEESKEQPEVSVKSVVVKCDKEKDTRFLWVSNINRYTKANDLKAHFTPYGKVQTARIVTDGRNYYGYLVMEKKEEVENCIKNLEETVFEGNKIHLSEKGPERRKSRSGERKQKEGSSRDRSRKSSRHSSKSNDPLTLKVRDRPSEENSKKYERTQMLREMRSEERRDMIRRKREAERIREERRKERIKYEERKAQEIKIEREKRRLEHERHFIEKEKMNLLRLQKKLADTERSLIQRQKQELERDIKNLEYKKHKSTETYERKAKAPRIEDRSKEYWKERSSPKTYEENFKKDNILIPPPPVLTESYHQKSDKERVWETKKEYSSERKEPETRYSYTDKSDYQDRYQKDRYKDKEKAYPWQGYSAGSTESWRQEPTRNIARHTLSFPITGNPYEVQTTPGYYQGTGYRKTNEYYYRGPERKY